MGLYNQGDQMQIQFNAQDSVDGHDVVAQHAQEVVRKALHRFGDHVTRVEIHISDVNGPKDAGGHDKRCVMEARLAGLHPLAVTELAGSVHQSIEGATQKLKRALDSAVGKMQEQRRTALVSDDLIAN
jgi:ribosome-associated translation inhibitor RaiA